jgi:hypothetical protein
MKSLYVLIVAALFVWSILLLFTRFVPPHTMLAFVAFFLLITIALTSTFVPIVYFVGLRFLSLRLYRTTMQHAVRQGALLSLAIVLNLLLRILHSWNIFMAIVIFAAAVVIEILSLAKK